MSTSSMHRLTLGLSLVAAAAIAYAEEGVIEPPPSVEDNLVIVAPGCVIAGNPIFGYVTGGIPSFRISADIEGVPKFVNPPSSLDDPMYFMAPTLESQAGKIMTFYATSTDEQSAGASTAIQ